MRLADHQIQTITTTVHHCLDEQAQVKLFGSRTDDNAKGGEIDLLLYAESKAFNPPLTLRLVEDLEHEPDLSLRLEAFTSRFCRLQDTLGDKLLPNLLETLQEPKSPFLVNLQKI
ncbi:hypothetical protein [Thiomicrorhabdus sp. Milos-T2]|uniref:hypothetical protein n=1 Tax=Thiomicrorhabdus sp. Milos-T2 TaxID=90814 RepID=UPI00068CBD81|nr:hypothetical protein [Thiomicrorhabdus sp. Milos-T2]